MAILSGWSIASTHDASSEEAYFVVLFKGKNKIRLLVGPGNELGAVPYDYRIRTEDDLEALRGRIQ